jgi:hypothetical protein
MQADLVNLLQADIVATGSAAAARAPREAPPSVQHRTM